MDGNLESRQNSENVACQQELWKGSRGHDRYSVFTRVTRVSIKASRVALDPNMVCSKNVIAEKSGTKCEDL